MSANEPWNPEYVGLPSFLRFAPTVTFSSFSDERWDAWGREIARPYQIVALPPYRRPDDLETSYQDSMWIDAAPSAATPVWDGFDPIALHEVIYECFSYAGTGSILAVRNAETGQLVEDPRDPAFLAARPRKRAGFSCEMIDAHHAALARWSLEGRCVTTQRLYNRHSYDRLRDVQERGSWWRRRGMTSERRDAAWRSLGSDLAVPHRVPVDLAGRAMSFDMGKRQAEMTARAAEIYGDEPMPELPPRPGYERSLLARLVFRGRS